MSTTNPILLVLTVGGAPEPLAVSIGHWRPDRVVFVHTAGTRATVDKVLEAAKDAGVPVPVGAVEFVHLDDGQDLARCIEGLARAEAAVREWLARGDSYGVTVDFTGGTKCMSAAMALRARQWPCGFSYVGGTERSKDGLGIVVTGKENVVSEYNPWNALGHEAIQRATALFDAGAFGAALALLEDAGRAVRDPARKKELAALRLVVEAYGAWDRFDHAAARTRMDDVLKNRNDLIAALGSRDRSTRLLDVASGHTKLLDALCAAQGATDELIGDLLANALRRSGEARWEDAVARVYRAVEAAAQLELQRSFDIPSTKRVPFGRVPLELQQRWAARPRVGDDTLSLGLQDAYELLRALGNNLGARFHELGWDSRTSPLEARNDSVLAHGFRPASKKTFAALWSGALDLAGRSEDQLPRFPVLGW